MTTVVLTGGPAAGKTTLALAAAASRERCAVVDVDAVRGMFVQPHVAAWGGAEGSRQMHLGVKNACALARNFFEDGCDVVIADVLSDETASLYRELIPDVLIMRLEIDPAIALKRAAARSYQLTRQEFDMLHREQAEFSSFDFEMDTGEHDVATTSAQICELLDRSDS